MEDRSTSGLYLEMSDLAPERYGAARAPAMATRSGVSRATWWANAHRDRHDLPRVLPEFGVLGMYEVDGTFTPPDNRADAVTGLHYVRTARPGQGSLTGEQTTGLLVVLISPRDGDGANPLRDWADFVHIRHIAESGVPGFSMITPYEHAQGGDPRYLHLYELVGGDPESAFRSMVPRVIERLGGGPGTETFDRWAGHPQLRIHYVNTFRLCGEVAPASRTRTAGA
jgi:hypothetical protein